MIRAGFDVSPLRQTRAGTARHVNGLLRELRGREGIEVVPLSFGGAGRASSLARDAGWYPLALSARSGLDVLHCPTFRGPLRPRVPTVVTVHDLAVVRFPELFPAWHRLYRHVLGPVVRAAGLVATVSEFTRQETIELLDVPAERVRVIGNGLDPGFGPNGDRAEGDYVLAVGTIEPRKNLSRIAEAARLAGETLRVVGAPGWGGVEAAGRLGEVSDAELAALYRGARCVVAASLYEGFGIPVLEAMASGVPVVTSDGGSLAEVAGGAAVLVDPLDPASIAAGIREAVARRDELVPLGLERAQSYTWAGVADRVEALWRELA